MRKLVKSNSHKHVAMIAQNSNGNTAKVPREQQNSKNGVIL